MGIIYSIAIMLLAYLVGSIPFGLFFTRFFSSVDIRSVGSGNIGATNVLRAAGKKAALLTLLADCLKGAAPVLAAILWLHRADLAVMAGAAAVLGHNFPVFIGFKGGKGVATSYGVMLALTPGPGLICLLLWLGAALIWRTSSLAALISFAAYPALLFSFFPGNKSLGALSLFLAGMIYYRHRENIKRLMAGTEPKIGQKSGS